MKAMKQLRRKSRDMMSWLLAAILLLGAAGILMQYSAAGGEMKPWAQPQLLRLIAGIIIMWAIAVMPSEWLMRLAWPAYVMCLGLLVAVEVSGTVGMGAQRWVDLGFMRIQPSEFTKLALILILARYYHLIRAEDVSHPMMLLLPLALVALPVLLVLKQPNLGTATILALTGLSILFMAGIRWHYFAGLFVAALASLPVGWQFLHDYQKRRVLTFLDPQSDPLGSGYNITQSIIAIGSGGFTGKGYLKGSQSQLDFLPEKQTDFIFTMVAEEFGFAGSAAILVLFAIVLGYGLALIMRSKSRFSAMIAAGVSAMLFFHIFINMAMVMGLVPVVGVPLPFLSYGGTFLLSTFIACGLLLNVLVNRDRNVSRNLSGWG